MRENAHVFAADVNKKDELQKAFSFFEQELGLIDCLINNAGTAEVGEFTYIPHEKNLNTDILGVINGIECILPSMQKRKSGTIINISSLADRKTRPLLATYAATKSAVKSLTESLRAANAKYGIRICNGAPGKIITPLLLNSNIEPKDALTVEDFAKMVL